MDKTQILAISLPLTRQRPNPNSLSTISVLCSTAISISSPSHLWFISAPKNAPVHTLIQPSELLRSSATTQIVCAGFSGKMNYTGDLNKVWEVKVLTKKSGEDEAKKILERIAKQVQPIMRNRKWKVKLLSEFCPTNPSLLGVNVGRGIQIKLRLRMPNRDLDFIPYDQVLDTMLHELCHNAHGPHNCNFYKLWDELRKECEELMAKGICGTGEGFDLPGKRLGGFTCQPPISSLRQSALSAAQKRIRLETLLPTGPKRLGGNSTIMGALSPIQAAAMAAERRLQDDTWCGSSSYGNFKEEGTKNGVLQNVEEHVKPTSKSIRVSQNVNVGSESSFIELSEKASTSSRKDAKSLKRNLETYSRSALHSSDCRQETYTRHNIDEPAMWECGSCTLRNPPLAPVCKLCSTQKPKDVTLWLCKFCTLENNIDLDKCSACEHWRYSHGPPVSSHAPNLGT